MNVVRAAARLCTPLLCLAAGVLLAGQLAPADRASALAELQRQPGVVAAPDAVAHAALVPNDPLFADWSWPVSTSGVEQAWDVTLGSPTVTIAIVDTGVAALPDLAPALVPGVDLVDGSGATTDPNGHGTEVASIAAARTNNALGIAGICGGCSIMPVRVLDARGNGFMSTIAAGVTWAVDHGADIVNLSLSGTSDSPVLDAAIADATARGVTVVVAAGNSGSADPASGGYPGASSPSAIRVAGAEQNGTLFPWSNHGAWVDLAAPGSTSALLTSGHISLDLQGTSFAASFVAGAAGLLLSHDPTLTPAALKQDLLDGGRADSIDVASGKRLDVYGALQAAGYVPPPAPTAPARPTQPTQAVRGTAAARSRAAHVKRRR